MKSAAIIGLGVMGASFARRLHDSGWTIYGYDTDPITIDYALDNGWISSGSTLFDENLTKTDLVIICIYPTKLKGVIANLKPWLKKGSVVMEISGVKSMIMPELYDLLEDQAELVSIHPMCGREARGPAFSDPAIFDRANYLIIPFQKENEDGTVTTLNSSEALHKAEDLGKTLGCASISTLSAKEHDEMIAFLSQLTHVIAVCLMNAHECAHLVSFTGDSFRDLTRIARINEDMWSELFILNKDALLEEIASFQNALNRFTDALKAEDANTMKEMFITSTERRQIFER